MESNVMVITRLKIKSSTLCVSCGERIKDNDRLKINQRWYVLGVLSDIKENDRLKINHRCYVNGYGKRLQDNDRLKKNHQRYEYAVAMCRIMICSKKYRGRNA